MRTIRSTAIFVKANIARPMLKKVKPLPRSVARDGSVARITTEIRSDNAASVLTAQLNDRIERVNALRDERTYNYGHAGCTGIAQ